MSILVVQVLPQGMIFGADRNITVRRVGLDSSGRPVTVVLGQSQRPKVLRWPNRKALIGYVGAGEIGGLPTDEWIYDYIGDHLEFDSFHTLAHDLSQRVEERRRLDEGNRDPQPLIIHLGGFEEQGGEQVPVIWFIRNPYGIEDGYYVDIRKEFQCTEEFWGYFKGVAPGEIRDRLNKLAIENRPFWFHQGLDLGTFNTLEMFLRGAFVLLRESHPAHSFPQSLREWEQHLRMAILTYGAYYEAFKGPGEQYVGGGADTVSLTWPEPAVAF